MDKTYEMNLLWGKVKNFKVAMLATVDKTGHLRSRPMYTQQNDFSNGIWFFTRISSLKVNELDNNTDINLSYSDANSNIYVSVSGTAQVVKSKKKAEELWTPAIQEWIPEGLDDEELVLIKVNAEFAEYWDTSSGKMITLFGVLNSIFQPDEKSPSGHRRIDLEK